MDTQEKLPSVLGKKAWGAVWYVESSGILLGPIQIVRDQHDLGTISFLLRTGFPELNSRDSVIVDT